MLISLILRESWACLFGCVGCGEGRGEGMGEELGGRGMRRGWEGEGREGVGGE